MKFLAHLQGWFDGSIRTEDYPQELPGPFWAHKGVDVETQMLYDPQFPVVNFDETPIQLIGETRVAVLPAPGQAARIDYEYRRHGTANLFVVFDRHRCWRNVDVTERRTLDDFADQMRALVDTHYPEAKRIRVVLDNLNTHRISALYERFEPEEARRIASRLEFHYTPKHASWLNMVEIEIGALSRQCLDRRIPSIELLRQEVTAWQTARNQEEAGINWLFDVEGARHKLGRHYPVPTLLTARPNNQEAITSPETDSAGPLKTGSLNPPKNLELGSGTDVPTDSTLRRFWNELRNRLRPGHLEGSPKYA
ncbi:IS630 family transposase [Microvenator marinus]|uniref:IS630 family transposase n=1 Tax=Microvenator marinus TaxID=2600177 RepID=A0A5B8XWK5_9DELT|nr:IS630 family transposase [Microvenator marinus]